MQYGTAPQSRPMMSIQESVRTCIRKYADFNGRATRAEFWWWVLATTIVGFAVSAVDGFINSFTGAYSFSPLSAIFGLAILLPDLAVTARRLHDIGKSGWWQLVWFAIALLAIIPIIVGVVIGLSGLLTGGEDWGEWWAAISWAPVVVGFVVAFLVWIGLSIWWLLWMVKQGPGRPQPLRPRPSPLGRVRAGYGDGRRALIGALPIAAQAQQAPVRRRN